MALQVVEPTVQRHDSDVATVVKPDGRARVLWGLACSLVVLSGYLLVLAANPRFFYQDDTDGGAVPIWIDVGASLRDGDLPILEPGQWMAGNYAVEGQTGLFNPAQALINLIAPSVDGLAGYATLVKLIFAIILATGVYRTALEYGAKPGWAAAAGAAMPFSGFTLYYDSASWVTGLMGSAWVAQAWASSVRYAKGRSGPLPAFAFLYLALSVGYVHSAIMAGIVVGVVIVGELVEKRWTAATRSAAVGLSAALAGAITYLPGALSSFVTWRGTITDPYQNDGFLSAAWSETLALSLPSQLPAIVGFVGPLQLAPVAYVAWFVLPALALVRWTSVGAELRQLAAPVVLVVVALVLTAGPSLLGPLRWPARLLPYLAMACLVLVAVLVSRHLVPRVTVPRLLVAGALVGLNVLRAASANPDLLRRHALAGLVVVSLTGLAIVVYRWLGARAAASLVLLSILPVLVMMVRWYPDNPNVNQWDFPASRSEALAEFPAYPGSTLQLGNYSLVSREERTLDAAWGDLVFGNYARLLQKDYVNAYTPVGFAAFSDFLCMDYAGSTCQGAYEAAFAIEQTTGAPYVDIMAVDRVVLQREMFERLPDPGAPDGWFEASANDQVIVLERESPRADTGSRASVTQGVRIESVVSSGGEHDHLIVSSPSGGRIVFARLGWPGYAATIDGEPVPVDLIEDMFVSIAVPASAEPMELRLDYRAPGYRGGMGAAAAGVGILAVLWLEWRRRGSGDATSGRDAVVGADGSPRGAS